MTEEMKDINLTRSLLEKRGHYDLVGLLEVKRGVAALLLSQLRLSDIEANALDPQSKQC